MKRFPILIILVTSIALAQGNPAAQAAAARRRVQPPDGMTNGQLRYQSRRAPAAILCEHMFVWAWVDRSVSWMEIDRSLPSL